MTAFRFFDPWAALDNPAPAATAAKLANPAKLQEQRPATLAQLAPLAGLRADFASARSSSEPPVARPTDGALTTWGEVEEERAAIVEHDGGVPRAWAEGFARLDPDRPPNDVPPHRWRCFVDDVGSFLDGRLCAVAAILGLTAFDLFGADRDQPFARIDQAGLLWLLNGDRLVMLTDDARTNLWPNV
jgi:hypothetical protein